MSSPFYSVKTNSSVPFHEACLNQQLSQVLTDSSTGRAHHEVQDDLPALHGVAVQTVDVSSMAVRAQRAALICPRFAPVGGRSSESF